MSAAAIEEEFAETNLDLGSLRSLLNLLEPRRICAASENCRCRCTMLT